MERNIAGFVGKLLKRGTDLRPDDEREIQEVFEAVRGNLRSAASVFVTGDRHAARVLSQQKEEFRRREADAIKAHFARLATVATPPRLRGRRSTSCATSSV